MFAANKITKFNALFSWVLQSRKQIETKSKSKGLFDKHCGNNFLFLVFHLSILNDTMISNSFTKYLYIYYMYFHTLCIITYLFPGFPVLMFHPAGGSSVHILYIQYTQRMQRTCLHGEGRPWITETAGLDWSKDDENYPGSSGSWAGNGKISSRDFLDGN